jgi:TP901 family phage tail tape measure protein
MANNISLGVIIGAALSGTFNRAFQSADQRAVSLGRSLQQVRLGRTATQDVTRLTAELGRLRAAETTAGTADAALNRQIADTSRQLDAARRSAERYGVNLGDITRENHRLLQSEQRLAGQLGRSNQLRTNRDNRSAIGGQMMGTAALGIGAAFAVAAPIKEAIEFESKMADIRKVGDQTSEELKKLGKEIIKSSTIMPMSSIGIGSIIEAGLQSGIAKTEILGFKDAAVKMGIAFDMSGEEAGHTMASWRAGMAISQKEAEDLADAVNHLDANMNATAKSISTVITRQGAVAKAAGLTTIQTAALSAALLNSGVQDEIAATALKNLTNALTKGDSASKSQLEAYDKLGLNSKRVAKSMQKDGEGTIKNVFKLLSKQPKHMQSALVGDLFGEEAKGAIMPLLVNLKALDDAFNAVADSTKYAGSMQKEYEIRSKTTANNAQLLSNKFDALKINIGSALLPTLNKVFGVIGDFSMKMAGLAEKFPRVTEAIVGVTFGLIGLKLAVLATAWTGTVFSTAWTLASGAMAFFNAGLIGTRIGLAALSIQAGIVTAAQWLWNASLFGCPLLWVAGLAIGLGTAAFYIWKNWDPLMKWFKETFPWLGTAVNNVKSAMSSIAGVGATIRASWEPLMAWFGEKFAWLGTAVEKVSGYAGTIGNAISAVGSFMTTPVGATAAPKTGKGAVVGAAMATTLALPAMATQLPPLPVAKAPQVVHQTTNATIHVTQKPGEDGNDLAERVARKIKQAEAKDKRGALHD